MVQDHSNVGVSSFDDRYSKVDEESKVKDVKGKLSEEGKGEGGRVDVVGEEGIIEKNSKVGEEATVGKDFMVKEIMVGVEARSGEDCTVGNGVCIGESLIGEGTVDLENIMGLDSVIEGDILNKGDMIGAEVMAKGSNVSDQYSTINASAAEICVLGDDDTIGDFRAELSDGNEESNIHVESITEDSTIAAEGMADVEVSGRHKDVRYRSRKRTSNPDSWKRNVLKRLENTGKEFTNYKRNPQRAKYMKSGYGDKCRFKCHSLLNRELRENIFHKFWKLENVT